MESRFGQGGVNDQFDPDRLLESIGLDEDEIAWRKRHIDFDEVADAVDAGVDDVAEATDEQARSVERVASIARETADSTERVAARTDDIAAPTQQQRAQFREVVGSLDRLTDDEAGGSG